MYYCGIIAFVDRLDLETDIEFILSSESWSTKTFLYCVCVCISSREFSTLSKVQGTITAS